MKRLISIALCFLMVFALCPSVFAAGENVCEINGIGHPTLDAALAAVQNGETIRLLETINYNSGIVIEDKRITFDLNGFNLNILNTTGGETIEENSGLYVKGNAAVSLEGEGEFNVTGAWYGVFAECNEGESAEVTVTNAIGIKRDGVAAQRSKVTVKGDATSSGSTYSGVWASYENAEVTVEGDVYANGERSMGVNADALASVTVKGSVIVNGENSIGIKASDDGDVTVEGNVTVSGIDCIGVSFLSVVDQPSIVTIKGVIEAEKYILFEAEDESKWEYSLRDGDFDEETADYIYYTKDNVSFVYVSMFAGGSGTVEDPYLIAHANQLYNIKYYHLFDKHYKQIADIDLDGYFSLGEGWDPIGLGESPFLGVYEGDGHTISNLFINRPYQGDIGLFGCVGEGSEILNVGLINADVTGRRDVGGLAAINAGIIANSYVTGKVSGTTYAGGLIGYNMGSVTDSYFDGTVSHVKGFDTDEVEYAGGLVGCNSEEGSITGCYAKATVESGGPLIGGLAGGNLGSITDSHAISAVTGYYYVGGLTGSNEGIVNNSYADGNVTGTSLVGGLTGLNHFTITDSYFTGTVTASDDYTGGLVGENSGGTIRNCHADATVTSTGDYIGGLAGRSIGLITGSWSAGAVTGGSYVGGLVGASFVNAGSGEISEGITASCSDCAVEGEMYVGGLAGDNETPISESYATGDVTGAEEDGGNYTYAGGLVGHNTGPASDSYAWGDVSGQDMVGGLIGYNEADVTNCYEIGAVTGENYTGGLIGSNLSGAEIIGSFWNNNTSGQDSSDGGESKGSVAMKQQVTYVNEDWNFETIWGIDLVQPYAFNDGYPFLIWQVGAEFAGGSGSVEDPYLVAHADQLYNVRNHLDKHFKLIGNIDLSGYSSGEGWKPIGTSANPFTGTFDGDGKVINNLFISRGTSDYVGLFGYTGKTAEIRNLGLENAGTTGKNFVGSLIGYSMGKIMNSYSAGNVNGSQFVGGLVGYNFREGLSLGGTITSSYSSCTVTAMDFDAGGLAGRNARGVIANSFATGNVSSPVSVGGLVGASVGEVGNKNVGLITNSYATGEVSATVQDAGGLVGQNSALISYSFATGGVSCPNNVGGLAGYIYNWGRTENSYWDTITSDQNASAGGGTGKTKAEMKQQITYADWDFATIWGINDSDNNGYPFLRWQGYEAAPTAPTAPQNFTATPSDGQVTLSWTAPASDGGTAISGYEVSKDNGATWVTASTSTSHAFTGLTNGIAYTFKVRAVNSAGNGAEASVSATPIATPEAYTVTVNGSYAAVSGAGSYAEGTTVTIDAGSRTSYSFNGWTSSDVTITDPGNKNASFIMPEKNVTVTANWIYIGGGSGSGSGTPTTPSYKADVKAGSGAEMTLPVTVDKDTGTASIDTGSQGLDQGGTNITIPSIPHVDTYSVGIPVPDLSKTDVQGALTLNTDAGSITVPSNMLTGVADADGNKAQITIGQGDKSNLPKDVKDAIGHRPLVQLTLSIDGRQIDWINPNAPVTVSIPYKPTAQELANPEYITVWYIDGGGNVVSVPNGRYDPTTGTVIFNATHFSHYAVAYVHKTFSDLGIVEWARKPIEVMASKGIINGTGKDMFSPTVNITRADYLVLLIKTLELTAEFDENFNDAELGSYYYEALGIAKKLGIAVGSGGNSFNPRESISRQDMMVLTVRALEKFKELEPANTNIPLDKYSDKGDIAGYAVNSLATLVKEGLIIGSGNKLNPRAYTTRAEAAVFLYKIYNK